MPDELRRRMIRAAYENPELRADLLPLLRSARTTSDVNWAADEIDKALEIMRDVLMVLEHRDSPHHEGGNSPAESHAEVGDIVNAVRQFSRSVDPLLTKMRRLH